MDTLSQKIKELVTERNWEQFHSPKNLAIGISIEANELLEIFIWLSEPESRNLSADQLKKVHEEVGDITINLINFCNQFDINPLDCAFEKLESIKEKYPISKAFGSAKKYNQT